MPDDEDRPESPFERYVGIDWGSHEMNIFESPGLIPDQHREPAPTPPAPSGYGVPRYVRTPRYMIPFYAQPPEPLEVPPHRRTQILQFLQDRFAAIPPLPVPESVLDEHVRQTRAYAEADALITAGLLERAPVPTPPADHDMFQDMIVTDGDVFTLTGEHIAAMYRPELRNHDSQEDPMPVLTVTQEDEELDDAFSVEPRRVLEPYTKIPRNSELLEYTDCLLENMKRFSLETREGVEETTKTLASSLVFRSGQFACRLLDPTSQQDGMVSGSSIRKDLFMLFQATVALCRLLGYDEILELSESPEHARMLAKETGLIHRPSED